MAGCSVPGVSSKAMRAPSPASRGGGLAHAPQNSPAKGSAPLRPPGVGLEPAAAAPAFSKATGARLRDFVVGRDSSRRSRPCLVAPPSNRAPTRKSATCDRPQGTGWPPSPRQLQEKSRPRGADSGRRARCERRERLCLSLHHHLEPPGFSPPPPARWPRLPRPRTRLPGLVRPRMDPQRRPVRPRAAPDSWRGRPCALRANRARPHPRQR